jgi:hypothetical protein
MEDKPRPSGENEIVDDAIPTPMGFGTPMDISVDEEFKSVGEISEHGMDETEVKTAVGEGMREN